MRQQLIHYVDLLFAGAPQAGEIKQEILQNTLDRFDDLIAQGKTPQAAYQLAICGIGDINELLGNQETNDYPSPILSSNPVKQHAPVASNNLVTGVAVAMYILCPVPLFILSDIGSGSIGLCMMFLLIAAATALLIIFGKNKPRSEATQPSTKRETQCSELIKSIRTLIAILAWVVFLALSFTTQAWLVTWLVFPISGAVTGLIRAILDLKEACKHEI